MWISAYIICFKLQTLYVKQCNPPLYILYALSIISAFQCLCTFVFIVTILIEIYFLLVSRRNRSGHVTPKKQNQIHFTSPAGWLPVHRDQLRAQCSVTSMGKLYLFYTQQLPLQVSRGSGYALQYGGQSYPLMSFFSGFLYQKLLKSIFDWSY